MQVQSRRNMGQMTLILLFLVHSSRIKNVICVTVNGGRVNFFIGEDLCFFF